FPPTLDGLPHSPQQSSYLRQRWGLRRCLVTLSGYTPTPGHVRQLWGRDPLLTGWLGELGGALCHACRRRLHGFSFLMEVDGHIHLFSTSAMAELRLKFRATETYEAVNEGRIVPPTEGYTCRTGLEMVCRSGVLVIRDEHN
ncbi:hypothetical protein BHE74_00053872, partial [Ensete ventricosum]